MPASAEAVKEMSWDEMQSLFAVSYTGEIAAVHRDGGDAALQAKLAGLSKGQRRRVREALTEDHSSLPPLHQADARDQGCTDVLAHSCPRS